MHLRTTLPLCLFALLVGWTVLASPRRPTAEPKRAPVSLVGNPEVVQQAYENFRRDRMARADGSIIEIGLGFWKGLMPKRTDISGTVAFDLKAATASITLQGGSQDALEVWAVENVEGPGRSVSPDSGDRMIRLASIQPGELTRVRTVSLTDVLDSDLALDLVAVTPAGVRPDEVVYATGAPSLFERLWVSEIRQTESSRTRGKLGGLLLTAAPSALPIAPASSLAPTIEELVAMGETVFFEEQFDGNGRTCGTCHPAENNFTIDKEFIATLDPGNPLFVAEFNPDLNADQNGGLRFETPTLMHEFGLITINPDGFDDLANRFVLRSVSHTFAQAVQLVRPDAGISPPEHRTGWSGDGSPGDGTLRSFAIGAVVQHLTRTMNRAEGNDFRLPTDDELDALEAFQLSLGRQSDIDLTQVTYNDTTVAAGFFDFWFACIFCHFDGGANTFGTMGGIDPAFPNQTNNPVPGSSIANGNFDTGVESRGQEFDGAIGFERPHDGGFGLDQGLVQPIGEGLPPMGDGTFNTPSLFEFADTVPAFHNHLTAMPTAEETYGDDPVEAAVNFYRSSAFLESPAGAIFGFATVDLSDEEVKRIGRFLRALNGSRNARDAAGYANRATLLVPAAATPDPNQEIQLARLTQLALADIEDGIQVLSAVGLHPQAVDAFSHAASHVQDASQTQATWASRHARWTLALSELATIPGIIGTGL